MSERIRASENLPGAIETHEDIQGSPEQGVREATPGLLTRRFPAGTPLKSARSASQQQLEGRGCPAAMDPAAKEGQAT
jgi:hypothetical protein